MRAFSIWVGDLGFLIIEYLIDIGFKIMDILCYVIIDFVVDGF